MSTKQSRAVILWRMCHDLGVTIFCVENMGGVYARFPVAEHHEIAGLYSSWFRAWLADRFFTDHGMELKQADIQSTLLLLESQARKTPRRRTFVRLARVGEKIYLDLANDIYQVVEIDETGWRVTDNKNSPAWFMRPLSMKPLPTPEEGGSLSLLRNFVNLNDADFVLLAGWLVASMNPDGPFPLLTLSSEHGSGKSTLTTLLERTIDPNTTERLAAFKDVDALFSTSLSRWIVPYDNLSRINDENSDHLCRLSTGGGYTKRQLFTDSESYSVTVKRPVILNGIALTLNRLDLLDRSWLIRLNPIHEKERRPEGELYAAFEKTHPKILGALLAAVACALRERSYQPTYRPRMADAAAFVMRAERGGGLPWEIGTFESVLAERENEKRTDTLMDDPVGSKIVGFAEGTGWDGPLKSLLQTIHQGTDIEERPFLPKHPKNLSKKLEELAPLLRNAGICCVKKKTNTGKWVTISSEQQNSSDATV
jgi:hypothetical protein